VFDVVLFDLDGVIRHFASSRVSAIEAAAGLPLGSIQATAFSDGLLNQATAGLISDDAWRDEIAARLAVDFPAASAREAVREWSSSIGAIDAEMIEIVRACRARHRVGLVSNATSRLTSDLATLGVSDEFDLIVSSATVGAAKPDRRIFDRAVRGLGSTHERAVFIDDTPGHVEAALSFGLRGFVHETNELSRCRLTALGVL
jgi:putative hydrolase of the HAD superfamily